MRKLFRHGDIDDSPCGGYNIMIGNELRYVSRSFMDHLKLEVTEQIADPVHFYSLFLWSLIYTVELSSAANGPLMAAAAGGRPVTTRRRFSYSSRGRMYGTPDGPAMGYNIEVNGEWQLLCEETPEKYLQDTV